MEVKGRNVFEKHDKGIKRILQQSLQCFSLLGLQAETEAVHERWHPYVSMVIPAWKLLWLHQLPCQHQPAHGDITFNSEITEYTSRWNQQNYALQTVHTITAELRSDLALQFFFPPSRKKMREWNAWDVYAKFVKNILFLNKPRKDLFQCTAQSSTWTRLDLCSQSDQN